MLTSQLKKRSQLGINRVLYKHTPSQDKFTISRDDDGAYVVSGKTLLKECLK